jgi:enoyl-CoA hydratase/carnithine racemase
MDAETAHRHGLVNVLVEDGKALAGSFELADRICANAPVAVHASRHVVLIGTHAPDEVGWDLSAEASARATASADFTEGLSAFIEKRSPKWMGR